MCVCVCVFWRSLCSNFFLDWETILRDFCVDWIIGCVVCWIAFISVFFTPRKTVLKSWLNTSSIPCYLSSFSSFFLKRNLDTSLIHGGSIEKAPTSSIASWHLVDQSSFCSWIWFFVARYLFDTSAVDEQFLDTYLESFLDTSTVEHYWRVYIFFHRDSSLISLISLDLCTIVHLPNTLLFTSNLFFKDSSSFFKFLFTCLR